MKAERVAVPGTQPAGYTERAPGVYVEGEAPAALALAGQQEEQAALTEAEKAKKKEEEKPFPWGYVALGVGVLAVVGIGIYFATRPTKRRRRRNPRRRARRRRARRRRNPKGQAVAVAIDLGDDDGDENPRRFWNLTEGEIEGLADAFGGNVPAESMFAAYADLPPEIGPRSADYDELLEEIAERYRRPKRGSGAKRPNPKGRRRRSVGRTSRRAKRRSNANS
jgi:hypothetical protein